MRFYGNIKFPIILSINCNLPRKKERKKRLNSSREGRRVYDIRTREKRKTGKVKRRDERDGEEKEEEEEEEDSKGVQKEDDRDDRERNGNAREIVSRIGEENFFLFFFFTSLKVSNVYLLFKIKDSSEFGKRSVWLHSS